MIRRIVAYFLFGLGLIILTFFRNYSSDIIPYPFIIWLLGLALFFGGWALLRFTPTIEESKKLIELNKLIEDLKINGEKIKVNFSMCDIKSNYYTEQRDRYGQPDEITTLGVEGEIQAWNALGGYSDKNIKHVDVYQSVLVFKNQNNDLIETFVSRVIPKEKTSLMFLLDDKKETILYVDKTDRTRYYFDLDFLNS